ncbi:DUF3238 domain-containing protein [Micromonospora zhanjiangensis]|uniref:DUF3238 domain-containing protein n=1 Tax=Micromonospora zhanjiangensis TaxID=1522057 RepID=A0ABV8KEA4_9ACTN
MTRFPALVRRHPGQTFLLLAALLVISSLIAGIATIGHAANKRRVYLTKSWLTYETYIPMAYLDAPEGLPLTCEGGADWWYSGDNRGPGFNTGKYRTRVAIEFDFSKKTAHAYKAISPTKRYKKVKGKLVYDSARTESTKGITLVGVKSTGSVGSAAIRHSATNPYCSRVASIDYVAYVTFRQNGTYEIHGTHDQMPNHEVYRQDIYSDGHTKLTRIFTHQYLNPNCLAAFTCDRLPYNYGR